MQSGSIVYNKEERVPLREWLLIILPVVNSFGYVFSASLGLGLIISGLSAMGFLIALTLYKKTSSWQNPVKNYAYILFLYSTLSLILTVPYNYEGIRSIFLSPALYLPYVSVLLSIKSYNFRILNSIVISMLLSSILFLYFSYIYFPSFLLMSGQEAAQILQEQDISFDTVSKSLGACTGFGILIAPCLKKKYLIPLLIVFFLNLALAILLGRRNIIFTNGLFLIIGIFNWMKYTKMRKSIKILLSIIVFCGIVYVLVNGVAMLQNSDNYFLSALSNKIDRDNRSNVIEAYNREMNNPFFYWIFGKGIDSTYYCPGVEETPFRKTIEVGWRHIIMKVGLIGFYCYLMIQIKPLLKRSTNILISGCMCYILVSLLELYPAGVPAFNLRYVLIWICVSICLDKRFRTLSQKEILSYINK